jgi:uncharacterized protein (DUF2267 family)
VEKQIIALIQEKTGISEQQAGQALEVVVGFLKEKLPPPIASQIDVVLTGDLSNLGDIVQGLGGLFGKKE